MEQGVYINMSDDDYHSIPFLSASRIKDIIVSPMLFWKNSWMNPEKIYYESEPMKLGKAYHKMILEGLGEFEKEYCPEFNPGDYPDALVTAQDIKDFLREMSLPITGRKEELIKRLKENDDSCDILDVLRDEYKLSNDDKTTLSHYQIKEIMIAKKMIDLDPVCSKCVSGGIPEITIIYEHEGVMMKSRIDYLKKKAIVDFKTYSNYQNKNPDIAVRKEIEYRKYNIQAATYVFALGKALSLIKLGKVFGDHSYDIDKMFSDHINDYKFVFLFHQTGHIPIQRAYVMPLDSSIMLIGNHHMEEGIERFKKCLDKYGESTPWADLSDIQTLYDEDFSNYAFKV